MATVPRIPTTTHLLLMIQTNKKTGFEALMDHFVQRTASSLRPAIAPAGRRVFSGTRQQQSSTAADRNTATFLYVNKAAPFDSESMWPSAMAKP